MSHFCLNELSPGETALVTDIHLTGYIKKRLSDIGLVKGTLITCLGRSPFGDPSAYRIRGSVFAIRSCQSLQIEIESRKGKNHG